uniref:Uncharacterized protein n=1 Tax=Brassica campestris TaxID=3711 RepID=M4D819_BRACM
MGKNSKKKKKEKPILSKEEKNAKREGYTGKLELHAIVGYKGKLELHTQPIKNTRGHPEVTHLPKVTSSSSSLSEKVKSLRPIFVESRNQEANSAVDCSSIHRVAIVFHSNSSLVIEINRAIDSTYNNYQSPLVAFRAVDKN